MDNYRIIKGSTIITFQSTDFARDAARQYYPNISNLQDMGSIKYMGNIWQYWQAYDYDDLLPVSIYRQASYEVI